MNPIQLISILIALCIYSTGFAAPLSNSTTSIKEQEPITLGQSYIIQNKESKTSIEINIYLPDSYESKASGDEGNMRYPVLYVIDGGKSQDFKHIAGLGALASINPFIFEELIIVGIATQKRLFELTSMNTDKRYARAEGQLGGADKFRSTIKNLVQPFVDKTFRTSSKKIVVGESLAGLFISETLLKTPELFTDYIAVSPSLWYDDRHLAKQAPKLLTKHDDSNRSFYVTMANEGSTMQKGLDEILDAIGKSGLKTLKTNYIDRRDNEFHWTIYHDAVLDALRWILPVSGPDYEGEGDPWYLIEGANPPDWKEG